ncbi:MAG: 3-deoxy-8-phosphooctulonate synthase [Bacteroidota bacterium]
MQYNIPYLQHIDSGNFLLIAGPCVIENETIPMKTAEKLAEISNKYKIPLIFKASYKKANRSRIDSFTGIGNEKGLKLLKKIRNTFQIPVITDIHSETEAYIAAKYVDILQIPAFLCRQTDLLVAAAKTEKIINIKKGQFLSGESMNHAVQKVRNAGNNNIMLTERGTTFGYQDLIVDFRNIPVMKRNNVPVILDVTHSLQQPNQTKGVTGGQPDMITTMAKAGIAAGADGVFLETHPNPAIAKSDGANMLKLDNLEELVAKLIPIYQTVNQ